MPSDRKPLLQPVADHPASSPHNNTTTLQHSNYTSLNSQKTARKRNIDDLQSTTNTSDLQRKRAASTSSDAFSSSASLANTARNDTHAPYTVIEDAKLQYKKLRRFPSSNSPLGKVFTEKPNILNHTLTTTTATTINSLKRRPSPALSISSSSPSTNTNLATASTANTSSSYAADRTSDRPREPTLKRNPTISSLSSASSSSTFSSVTKQNTQGKKENAVANKDRTKIDVNNGHVSKSTKLERHIREENERRKNIVRVAIDSATIVKDSKTPYSPYFKNDGPLTVTLEYPGVNAREKFLLHAPIDDDDHSEYHPVEDIITTIRAVAAFYVPEATSEKLFGNETEGLIRKLIRASNRRDGPLFVEAVEEYNAILVKLKADGLLLKRIEEERGGHTPFALVNHVLHQIYSRTVAPEADSLQQYKAFSNNVYGEVNPVLVKEFIELTGIKRNSCFVDFGCGIGNVVLHVGLQAACQSYGIEIMDIPGDLALLQLKEFKARMWYYGLPHSRVRIWKGDFMKSPEIVKILKVADVIFVNNYAFDQGLNHALMQLFLDVREDVRIISLKSFVPENYKVTSRNADTFESILKVKKHPYYSDAVSWTNAGGNFYIHTIDREPLNEYYQTTMNAYKRPSRSSTRR